MKVFNGASGIPRQGREMEYATEMWLDDPTAFFLHPEGPLSETTPDEWRAKMVAKAVALEAERATQSTAMHPPMINSLNQMLSHQLALHQSSFPQNRNHHRPRGLLAALGL